MKKGTKDSSMPWFRLCFLLSPEDSSEGSIQLPPWVTPCYLRIKTTLWVVVSIAMAVLIGQL
jgi:hypothetical protein